MKYAVIFTARLKNTDARYFEMASKLRQRAEQIYGCVKFTSVQEKNHEISISYWDSKAQIKKWKNDTVHLDAQKQGKARWYEDYTVEVVELLHVYKKDT